MRHPRLTYSIHGWIAALGLWIAVALPAWCDSAQEGVPMAYPKSRYETLLTKNPFSVAGAAQVATAPQPGFAANWFVSGIARIGDSYFVTIKSRDLARQFSLFGGETDRETGVSLVSLSWSDIIGRSTVIVRKGTEVAKLGFNEADLRSGPTAAVSPAPETKVAENPALGLPRGAPELSGMTRTANAPRFAPAMTPPPGNGPSRIPWDAGAVVGLRRSPAALQPH